VVRRTSTSCGGSWRAPGTRADPAAPAIQLASGEGSRDARELLDRPGAYPPWPRDGQASVGVAKALVERMRAVEAMRPVVARFAAVGMSRDMTFTLDQKRERPGGDHGTGPDCSSRACARRSVG
jgi:hypothetical protein